MGILQNHTPMSDNGEMYFTGIRKKKNNFTTRVKSKFKLAVKQFSG